MKKILSLRTTCLFLLGLAVSMSIDAQSNAFHIIPEPVSVKPGKGIFVIKPGTHIVAENTGAAEVAETFAAMLNVPTGYSIAVQQKKAPGAGNISLHINEKPSKEIGKEGYVLKVSESDIAIRANDAKGLFYAVQTIFQMLPPDAASLTPVKNMQWTIPCAEITDYPRFGWRGLMLDVSRHFFPKEFVKRYIDQMAHYKFNIFHIHLSDDQGWRIEIKGLPKLTEVGAWRVARQGSWWSFQPPQPGEKADEGGFYTQDDIREIVAYAKERHIEVLPEIDVPGHSLAAIAAYPYLSATKYITYVNPGSRFYNIEDNTLDPADERVYDFLDTVFTQIAALFPFKYIHVGGDECTKLFWHRSAEVQDFMKRKGIKTEEELQSYFIKRMEKILQSKGKKLLGWDEILEGGLADDATVMSWRGMEGGIKSAKMGHHVVMTPSHYAYLDLYQGDPLVEPETYSMLRLRTCYDFEPVPDGINAEFILGGQGNLWTESVPHGRQAEYMTWPRAFALSEVFWSPKQKRNWKNFIGRVEKNFSRLDKSNTLYARSMYDAIITGVKSSGDSLRVKLATEIDGLDIYYTFDGTNPDLFTDKYQGRPLGIPKGASQIRVRTYRDNNPAGVQINFPLKELENRLEK